MHLVTLVDLVGPIDGALGPLAECLGTTAYELRLVLNAGLPAVVLATDEEERAADTLTLIQRLGHKAQVCDRRAVVPSLAMTRVRDFAFLPTGLAPTTESPDRLPYSDLLCILRALHRSTTETVTKMKERTFRPVMAVATGGLVLSKETEREVRSQQQERQQVLYLFRRGGAPPWILRERETNYGGLGAAMQPTSLLNFNTTVDHLRRRAPDAVYDDRLTRPRPVRGIVSEVEACDILAHALAAHFGSEG